MTGRADTIIRNGTVIDGSGAPRHRADLAIDDGRIAAMGDLGGMAAICDVDAAGRVVAPGFIDAHTHDDGALIGRPDMTFKVSQGVTTVVIGNCGFSMAPLTRTKPLPEEFRYLGADADYCYPTLRDYIARFESAPAAVNAVPLIGHSTLRVGAMADVGRPANDREIGRMQAALRDSLDAGATGFSTGLEYPPNAAATTDEVTALAATLAPFGGLYATHIRDYVHRLDAAIDEALEIGRRAGVPVLLSHHQGDGPTNHGHAPRTLARIDGARRSQSVDFDVYPYLAGAGTLDPKFIAVIERVVVTRSETNPNMIGRDLREIAAEWGVDRIEAARRLMPGGAIYYTLSEDDVRDILRHPRALIGSDSLPLDPVPHPRMWGTFPRVLGHYCRDLGLFSLEEAVRRMTGSPADRFGLAARGRLAVGAVADIAVFDPATVMDRATFERSTEVSAGIDLVLVAGEPVWRQGRSTGARPGRVLRRGRG